MPAPWPEVFASMAGVIAYLTGLRVLTRQHEPDPYLAVLAFAQRYVAAVDWSSYATAESVLRATRAFDRPGPDVKLVLPRTA